jgi:hypothetical protein
VRDGNVAVAVAAVLAGCASPGGLSKDSSATDKESAVAERAKARWQALIKRNYQEAYGFFSPASKDNDQNHWPCTGEDSGIDYRSVSIDKVECVAEVCTVKLTLTYDYTAGEGQGRGHIPWTKAGSLTRGRLVCLSRDERSVAGIPQSGGRRAELFGNGMKAVITSVCCWS